MIVTTTGAVDGYLIARYFDPIVVSLVDGTDFVTDIAARFTDILGGTSHAYEAQLRELHSKALGELKSRAETVGANGLVGVRLDCEGISGKGMQMFMLNAIGTP